MSNRTDVKYSKRKIHVPNASTLGHDVGYVLPGYWIAYRDPDSNQVHMGRAVCVVDTLPSAVEQFSGKIVVAVLSASCDAAFERWIDPESVIRSTPHVPSRVLEFMMSDFSDRDAVVKRMADGFPTGFNHYLSGDVPIPDPQWSKAVKVASAN
jgi:hypothetical protein